MSDTNTFDTRTFDQCTFKANLTRVFNLVGCKFDNVVLTGSSAIVFLILHHPCFSDRSSELLAYLGYDANNGPADYDFIVVQNTDFHSSAIGEFVSEQGICGSKTFVAPDGVAFDIIKVSRCKYIVLDGINIIHPSQLKANYTSNLRESDTQKLRFLSEYEHLFADIESDVFDVKPRRSNMGFSGVLPKSIFASDTDSESEAKTYSDQEDDFPLKVCRSLF